MKTFEIEFRRVSYITLWIDAESKEEAESKAWREVETNRADINDSQWDIEFAQQVDEVA